MRVKRKSMMGYRKYISDIETSYINGHDRLKSRILGTVKWS